MIRTLTAIALLTLSPFSTAHEEPPSVTENEIKIGATFPFSGPASPLGNTGWGLIAYVESINDRVASTAARSA